MAVDGRVQQPSSKSRFKLISESVEDRLQPLEVSGAYTVECNPRSVDAVRSRPAFPEAFGDHGGVVCPGLDLPGRGALCG